ncbi:unnamed protein product [Boreogadus saida]
MFIFFIVLLLSLSLTLSPSLMWTGRKGRLLFVLFVWVEWTGGSVLLHLPVRRRDPPPPPHPPACLSDPPFLPRGGSVLGGDPSPRQPVPILLNADLPCLSVCLSVCLPAHNSVCLSV